MIPGGFDLVFLAPGHDAHSVLDIVSDSIEWRWAEAVWMTGEGSRFQPRQRPAGTREILVFQDAAAEASWVRDGASDENRDSMIHVIADTGRVTLVVCSEETVIVRGMIGALERVGMTRAIG